jgi:hypothetical protein
VVGLEGDCPVVGDHDDGEALVAVELFQEGEDFAAGFLVEVAGGLVGEKELGLGDQGAGDGGALHLASGELARLVGEAMAEADEVEELLGSLDECGFVPPITEDAVADHDRREDVFERRELRKQVIELKDHSELLVAEDVASARGEVVDAAATKVNFAGVGGVERAEQVQERAFAAAALANDGNESAFADLEIDALEDRDDELGFAVGFFEAGGGEERGGVGGCGGVAAAGRGGSWSTKY